MHERVHAWRDEAVVDEEVFLDVEPCVTSLEVTGPVARHAVSERQVLRTRRRLDRIRLEEPEGIERVLQVARDEQASRDRIPTKMGRRQDA